jgi:DM4/DM12 family
MISHEFFRMGYDGRECVLRALCEAPRSFGKKGSHMIAELIRTVFSFPRSKVLPFEHRELMIYDEAYRKGKSGTSECHDTYPNCGFSLIKLALGEYSKTLKNFM